MGGFETTAHTLSFTVFCIADNLDVQDRIAAELTSLGLLRGHNGKSEARGLEYEDLPKLSYLDSVLKESMRMFPVVAGFPRYRHHPSSYDSFFSTSMLNRSEHAVHQVPRCPEVLNKYVRNAGYVLNQLRLANTLSRGALLFMCSFMHCIIVGGTGKIRISSNQTVGPKRAQSTLQFQKHSRTTTAVGMLTHKPVVSSRHKKLLSASSHSVMVLEAAWLRCSLLTGHRHSRKLLIYPRTLVHV